MQLYTTECTKKDKNFGFRWVIISLISKLDLHQGFESIILMTHCGLKEKK